MASAPLSTSTMRDEYAAARCDTSEMVRVDFYGYATGLLVERHTAAAWRALSAVMKAHDYRFRESAGGTYNCRPIGDTGRYSLHAYGLALDINPSKNGPQGTSNTDQPAAFRADVKRIVAGGRQVFAWGGDWSPEDRDPMHWQIGARRSELAAGLSGPGTDNGNDGSLIVDKDDEAKVERIMRDVIADVLSPHDIGRYVWTFDLPNANVDTKYPAWRYFSLKLGRIEDGVDAAPRHLWAYPLANLRANSTDASPAGNLVAGIYRDVEPPG